MQELKNELDEVINGLKRLKASITMDNYEKIDVSFMQTRQFCNNMFRQVGPVTTHVVVDDYRNDGVRV